MLRERAERRSRWSCTASRRRTGSTSASSAAASARSPATSPTRRRPTCRQAARDVPDELLLVETDSPYLAPQPRARQAERAGERGRARPSSWPSCAASRYERARGDGGAQRRARLRLVSEPRTAARRAGQPAPPARVRRAAQPRARPELPDRRQHPRRDRARGRARRRRRRARGRAAGWACCPSTWRRASAHLHVVEVDRVARAGAARRARAVRQRHAAPRRRGAARLRARSTRRPPRSWRTCPTASRPP